jgi:drug/metabolite transporter (DMT)-like permease
MIAVILLGLAAAFLFAVAAFLQRRGAKEVLPSGLARDSTGLRRLVSGLPRSRTWLLGAVTNVGAFGMQAWALAVGSVAVVQSLLATELLFVLGLASAGQRRWPAARDCGSALAVCVGLVVLLAAGGTSLLGGSPRRARVLLATVCVVVLVVVLSLVGRVVAVWLASMLVGSAPACVRR